MTTSFSKQFKKMYNYIHRDGEQWDNIYPQSEWTLEDHKTLWDCVWDKILCYDISKGGFVFTDLYIEEYDTKLFRDSKLIKELVGEEEEVETDCHICGDYMSDVEQEDYKGGCNVICDTCGGEEDEEGCWWIKGKGGDKCWEENCGCSEGEEEEEIEECDRCGNEDITECMSNKCRDLEAEEEDKIKHAKALDDDELKQVLYTYNGDDKYILEQVLAEREEKKKQEKKKQEIIATIKKEIPFVDIKQFSHNIISLELGFLEEVAGREAVVELVQTTELKNKGWGFITSMGGVGENLNV